MINVLLLVGVLGWLFFKPVRAALQARQDAEQQRRDELAARATEIETERAALDQRLRALETEMDQIRQRHMAAATQEAAAIRRQAHEAVEREREAATRALAQLERAQVERLSAAIATTTRESVVRLLAMLDAPDLELSLVNAACRRFATLDDAASGAVLVESASPLSDRARAALIAALSGKPHTTQFRVAPELGAGLRIVTSSGLIDASALGMAREAERTLTNALALESAEARV